jgi:hypothetical protein
VFRGAYADYDIVIRNASRATITDRTPGRDGNDESSNVEVAYFTGKAAMLSGPSIVLASLPPAYMEIG